MSNPYNDLTLCGDLHATQVLSHYAYGDPLPHNARFISDDDGDVIVIFVACQREANHAGKHLAKGTTGWNDLEPVSVSERNEGTE